MYDVLLHMHIFTGIVIGVGGEGIDTRTLKPGIVKLGDYLKNQGF